MGPSTARVMAAASVRGIELTATPQDTSKVVGIGSGGVGSVGPSGGVDPTDLHVPAALVARSLTVGVRQPQSIDATSRWIEDATRVRGDLR